MAFEIAARPTSAPTRLITHIELPKEQVYHLMIIQILTETDFGRDDLNRATDKIKRNLNSVLKAGTTTGIQIAINTAIAELQHLDLNQKEKISTDPLRPTQIEHARTIVLADLQANQLKTSYENQDIPGAYSATEILEYIKTNPPLFKVPLTCKKIYNIIIVYAAICRASATNATAARDESDVATALKNHRWGSLKHILGELSKRHYINLEEDTDSDEDIAKALEVVRSSIAANPAITFDDPDTIHAPDSVAKVKSWINTDRPFLSNQDLYHAIAGYAFAINFLTPSQLKTIKQLLLEADWRTISQTFYPIVESDRIISIKLTHRNIEHAVSEVLSRLLQNPTIDFAESKIKLSNLLMIINQAKDFIKTTMPEQFQDSPTKAFIAVRVRSVTLLEEPPTPKATSNNTSTWRHPPAAPTAPTSAAPIT